MSDKYTIQNYVTRIRSGFAQIVTHIQDIGDAYVEACRKYSNAKSVFKREFPQVSKETWEKFRKIGERKLAASALFLPTTLTTKLVKAKVRVESQEKIMSGVGIRVYRPEEKKEVVIPFAEITSKDEDAVFDSEKGQIRSAEDQKKWYATKRVHSGSKWRVNTDGDGIVVWRGGFTIRFEEIADAFHAWENSKEGK